MKVYHCHSAIASLLAAPWQGTPPLQASRRLRGCAFGAAFYPNAIPSSLTIRHVKPTAQSICTGNRKILRSLVITASPPEGDRRQAQQRLCPAASRSRCAPRQGRQTDRRAAGAALTAWGAAAPLEGLELCYCRAVEAFCCVSPPSQPRPPPRQQPPDWWCQQICSCGANGSWWRTCCPQIPRCGSRREYVLGQTGSPTHP